MPSTSVKLGRSAGDVLSSLVGGSPKAAGAYGEGLDSGSKALLRGAQMRNLSADTQKIMGELQAAQAAQKISGVDVAESMGVPRETASAITRGQTTMPSYVRRAGEVQEPIAPGFIDKTRRANTMKILQTLGGGNAATLSQALGGQQEQALLDNMLSGQRTPGDVAPVMAALAGRDPEFTSSRTGGRGPTAKVQEMNFLMSPKGGGLKPEAAARRVFGDEGASMWIRAYTAISDFYDPAEAAQKATESVLMMQQVFDPSGRPPGEPPVVPVVRDYTQPDQ